MKRFILVGSVVLSAVSVAPVSPVALAQPRAERCVWDSGVVTLGTNQVLRTTIAARTPASGQVVFVFRRIEYMEDACAGAVCKYTPSSQSSVGPMQLAPGEAVVIDTPKNAAAAVRAFVLQKDDVTATFSVMNALTGEIVAFGPPSGDFGCAGAMSQ